MVDKFINPVLLYGCDVQDFHNAYLFEKLHLKLCNTYIELVSLSTKLNGIWETLKISLNDKRQSQINNIIT